MLRPLAFLAALVAAAPAWALSPAVELLLQGPAIKYVQSAPAFSTGSAVSSAYVTFPAPVKSGGLVTVYIGQNTGAAISSIVDNAGNNYTVAASAAGSYPTWAAYNANVVGGPTRITVTMTGAYAWLRISADEFSGPARFTEASATQSASSVSTLSSPVRAEPRGLVWSATITGAIVTLPSGFSSATSGSAIFTAYRSNSAGGIDPASWALSPPGSGSTASMSFR